MKKLIMVVFGLVFLSCAYAKDLTMTYQQYMQMTTPAQIQQFGNNLKQYSHFILVFQPGNQVQLVVDGNLFQTASSGAPTITVKNKFWLKMPVGQGDIYVSGDGQHYKKLKDGFTGVIGFYPQTQGPTLGVSLNAGFLPPSMTNH